MNTPTRRYRTTQTIPADIIFRTLLITTKKLMSTQKPAQSCVVPAKLNVLFDLGESYTRVITARTKQLSLEPHSNEKQAQHLLGMMHGGGFFLLCGNSLVRFKWYGLNVEALIPKNDKIWTDSLVRDDDPVQIVLVWNIIWLYREVRILLNPTSCGAVWNN